jgi:cell division septation protein DedD
MDIKFEKDSTGSPQGAADNKGRQGSLIVLMLILVGGFAYIYFFTGLIKPMPEQKPAGAPSASPVEKKPLPSPEGAPAKGDAAAPAPVAIAPVASANPAAAPVAGKPAPQGEAKPQEDQKASDEPQTKVKKTLPGSGKAGAAKTAPPAEQPAPVAAKPAAPVEKPAPVKEGASKPVEVKKPVEKQAAPALAAATTKKDVAKPAKKKDAAAPAKPESSGNWTVLVGNYVLEDALAVDLARVRKAGLEAFVVPGPRKKTPMNRLLLAEFTDRESAQVELAKLKRVTSDAFIADSAGMHIVYAGSYLLDKRAASEKERLSAAGFKLTLIRADVSLATRNLTAGSFAEKKTAEAALKKLRAAGVKASLTRQ